MDLAGDAASLVHPGVVGVDFAAQGFHVQGQGGVGQVDEPAGLMIGQQGGGVENRAAADESQRFQTGQRKIDGIDAGLTQDVGGRSHLAGELELSFGHSGQA